MELRQLQCLVVCAKEKSFSKAAALLYTSQSNVSKTIASLEKELGTSLFYRRQHGIELTPKGKQVVKLARTMMEYGDEIARCVEEEETEELKMCFQPNAWFASAFCDYYLKFHEEDVRYSITGASLDEMIRRISGNLDELGFAYVEESALSKLEEVLHVNHIGYITLMQTRTRLYYGRNHTRGTGDMISLIQGAADDLSGLSFWKDREAASEKKRRMKLTITTNSDYLMQELLKRTELCSISAEDLMQKEGFSDCYSEYLEDERENLRFICIFRNDRNLERLAKKYLLFIREYIDQQPKENGFSHV